jgi:microcystin-dependent protein
MKKKTFIKLVFFLLFLSHSTLFAQRAGGVLISSENNNEKADPSAILEVKSTEKGVLIPRLSLNERDNIRPNTDALTVFVTDDEEKGFWYFDDSEQDWVKLLVVDPGSPGMLVPQMGVIMYCGSSSNFDPETGIGLLGTEMEGWRLCNGIDNAPDLTGRFIVGHDPNNTDYNSVAKPKGNINYTMSEQFLPPHTHLLENSGDINMTFSHTHTPEERGRETDPGEFESSHSHPMPTKSNDSKGKFSRKSPHKSNDETFWNTTKEKANIVEIKSADAIVNVTIKDDIIGESSGGSKLSVDNRPLYYVLAYIIRMDTTDENP